MGMETFSAGDDLVVEVHLRGEPLVKVRSQDMERDGETAIIVWPSELRPLVEGLLSAATILAEHAQAMSTG